jgi:hypothetical protein
MPNLYHNPVQFANYLFTGIDVLARRRFVSILVVFFLSFGGSWLLSAFRGIPVPFVHDEFSYLLAGDTFAHGRITNAAHPLWEYFETFNVLQQPSYMSKYPPGQGLFLAVGQVVFGHPIYGVWLSAGLMCAAICWMLYSWVSPRWALIGGLVAVLQFGIFTYWSQSYWGGAVAGIGGALTFGALPRIFKTQRIRDALWLGLGFAVLVNSRPFEGVFVAIPVGCLVLPWKIRWRGLVLDKLIKRVILPLSLILFITILGMGAYNKQITGESKVFPYLLYNHTYENVPLFIWQPRSSRLKLNHKIMELQEKNFLERYYIYKKTAEGFVKSMQQDSLVLSMFFFGYPLAIPSLAVLLLFFFHRQKAARFWMALLILLGAYAAMSFRAADHYFSPLTCLAVLLIVIGLRGLAGLKLRNTRVGLVCVIFLIALQLILNITLTPRLPVVKSLARSIQSFTINLPLFFTREELKNILMKRGGKYLVIVKYPLSHNYFFDWVYNEADIDYASIVWARDMGDGNNKKLLEYFKDRQVLFIDVYWDMPGVTNFNKRQ